MGLFTPKIKMVILLGNYKKRGGLFDNSSPKSFSSPDAIETLLKMGQRLSDPVPNVRAKHVLVLTPQEWNNEVFDDWSINNPNGLEDFLCKKFGVQRYGIRVLFSEKEGFVIFYAEIITK